MDHRVDDAGGIISGSASCLSGIAGIVMVLAFPYYIITNEEVREKFLFVGLVALLFYIVILAISNSSSSSKNVSNQSKVDQDIVKDKLSYDKSKVLKNIVESNRLRYLEEAKNNNISVFLKIKDRTDIEYRVKILIRDSIVPIYEEEINDILNGKKVIPIGKKIKSKDKLNPTIADIHELMDKLNIPKADVPELTDSMHMRISFVPQVSDLELQIRTLIENKR